MKIGLFTDTFYPEINGVATSCLNLQRELTRRGHEVHVYAPKCKGWEENQRENVHYLASAPLLVLKDRTGFPPSAPFRGSGPGPAAPSRAGPAPSSGTGGCAPWSD